MRLILLAGRIAGLMTILTLGLPAQADPSAKLAPPGPCAEPREAVGAVAPSSFSVVGPLQDLFSPADVAAGPATPSRGVPSPAGMIRPGPCDQPGAGCNQLASPVARPGATKPVVPGGRPADKGGGKPIDPGTRPGPPTPGLPGTGSTSKPGVRPAPASRPGGAPGVRPKGPMAGGDL